MGRTFLDIDMARAADLLGMERRQAEVIRDLARGQFLALGPAISRRPINIRIGDVRTATKSGGPILMPLPGNAAGDMEDLLFSPGADEAPPSPPPPSPVPADELIRTIAAPPVPDAPVLEPAAQEAVIAAVMVEIAGEGAAQPPAALYQDFLTRCRMRGVSAGLDMAAFGRRLALARAGIEDSEEWEPAIALGASLPEEMLAPFLALARAARDAADCPGDAELAALYGTASSGRARRMLDYMEEKGLIVCRVDLAGKRSVSLPHLGWTTAASVPDPAKPSRLARIDARPPRAARAG
jgi:hypothetical protein